MDSIDEQPPGSQGWFDRPAAAPYHFSQIAEFHADSKQVTKR
jgi:hypothetical protein